jgi:hypothetical protein
MTPRHTCNFRAETRVERCWSARTSERQPEVFLAVLKVE